MSSIAPLTLREFFDYLRRAPFVRLLLPLLLGIVMQAGVQPLPFLAAPLLVCVLLLIIGFSLSRWKSTYHGRWIWGLLFNLAFFLLGCALIQQSTRQSVLPLGQTVTFQALVCNQPQVRANSIRMEADILAYDDSTGHWRACRERVFLYLRNDSATTAPQVGELLLCNSRLTPTPAPQNPLEFNHQAYLAERGVFATAFIDSNKVQRIDTNRLSFFRLFPLRLQAAAFLAFQQAGLEGDELAVATALTTGNKYYLDDELRQAYSSAGAIHLLAVSGLHVGIVFMILNYLFAFMDKVKRGRIAKGILIILMLWIYAAVAGLAPSVVRASFMFSVFSIGEMAGKPRNTYNNIAFSAFVLCMVNPYCLFDTGFQLSYAAVLGIVYFQPKLQALLPLGPKWFRQVWSLACVTLSAQLATLPIILYTFHQFPTYFLVANMLVVPLTPIVMYFAVAVLAFTWWPLAGSGLGWCLTILIKLLNGTVAFFERLPRSLIEGIYINSTQCILLVACVLLLAAYWVFLNNRLLKVMLISLIGVFIIRAAHLWTLDRQLELGAYSVPRASFTYLIDGREGWCLRDSSHADKRFDFNTRNHLIAHGFKSERCLVDLARTDSISPNFHRGILLFHGKRIAWLSQLPATSNYQGAGLELDYLFVDTRSAHKPEQVLSCFKPSLLIVDNNVPQWQATRWTNTAKEKGVNYHYTKDKKNFVKNRELRIVGSE